MAVWNGERCSVPLKEDWNDVCLAWKGELCSGWLNDDWKKDG